jgi:signal transduction histidine kinase
MIAFHTPDRDNFDVPWFLRRSASRPEPLLRSLAAGLAHNVNNPLLGVIGSLELALRKADPGSALRDLLQQSLSCAQFAAETVRRLVAFAFHPPGVRVPLSLGHVVARAARKMHDQGNGHGLLIRLEGESSGLVWASEPLVELVLEQLLANARESMQAGGILSLRVWDESPFCCLSVSDSGPGLSPEARAHLFEPFFSTKGTGHVGLGLVLCRDLVESEGGRLDIASYTGEGVTVTLTFPVAVDGSTGPEDMEQPRGPGRGLTLCV